VTEELDKPSDQPEIPEIGESKNLLPASIVLAAILISVSIFYNANLIVKKLDSSPAVLGGSTAQNQQATGQNNEGPVAVPLRSEAPVLGRSDAKVTIIEFSDFQCPYCQRFFNDTFGQLKSRYIDTGGVKFVFRNFPLSGLHQNAEKAAEAAECANRQGKFWQYHDLLFKNGQSDGTGLDTASLKKYADELGLDQNKFNQCLDNGEAAEVINKDIADGGAVSISGTPIFFINGKELVGAQPFAAFEQAIEDALKG